MTNFDSISRKNVEAQGNVSRKPESSGSVKNSPSPSNQSLQRKVRVGSVNDPMEAEADRAADAVLAGDTATVGMSTPTAPVQKKCAQCEGEETESVQRQPMEEEEEMLQPKAAEGGLVSGGETVQRMEGEVEELGTVQRQPEEEEDELQMKAAEGGLSQGRETVQRMQTDDDELGTVQRQPMEEEEEMLQPKEKGGSCQTCGGGADAGATAASAVESGGSPLSEQDRSYFEPRFGRDFSDVRVHTHSTAERAAGDINARAYTLGSDIAFGSGQYSPNSESGRHLMAHELAHVVQQKGNGTATVRRAVSSKSKCKANKHGASGTPLDDLKRINDMAWAQSTLADLTLALITLDKDVFKAEQTFFKERFGEPPASGKKFKNRWTGKKFDKKEDAFFSEIDSASGQYTKITAALGKSIKFTCAGKKSLTLPGCKKNKCKSDTVAFVCPGSKLRQIAVCPNFWNMSEKQLGGALIHEAVHGRLNRPGHPEAVEKRHKNPECYTSFVADLHGYTPFDTKCPKI